MSTYKDKESELRGMMCPNCKGEGKRMPNPMVATPLVVDCPSCNGDGIKVDKFEAWWLGIKKLNSNMSVEQNKFYARIAFNAGAKSK